MVGKLGVIALGMFAFGYALVPIYRAICEALGINILAWPSGGAWSAATRLPSQHAGGHVPHHHGGVRHQRAGTLAFQARSVRSRCIRVN
jgi:hypothetical protein